MTRGKRAGWLLLAVAITWLDLWSKGLWPYPSDADARPERVVVIENWLYVRTTYNPGGVWSLKISSVLLKWATTLAVPLLLLWILLPGRAGRGDTVGKAMVLGGAAGNFYDRWRYDAVRDWIDVCYGDVAGRHYPTFNVADACLVTGILLLLLLSWKKP